MRRTGREPDEAYPPAAGAKMPHGTFLPEHMPWGPTVFVQGVVALQMPGVPDRWQGGNWGDMSWAINPAPGYGM